MLYHRRMARRQRADATLGIYAFRVADDELEQIKAAADAAGMTSSSYIRLAALGTASLPEGQQQRVLTAGVAEP